MTRLAIVAAALLALLLGTAWWAVRDLPAADVVGCTTEVSCR